MCRFLGSKILSFQLLILFEASKSVMCIENSSSTTPEPISSKEAVLNLPNLLYPTNNDTVNMHKNILSSSIQAQSANSEFRPSVELGLIKEPCRHQLRKSQPFNHVSHVQFDNSVNIEPEQGTVLLHPQQQTTNPKFHDTDSRYVAAPSIEHHELNPYHHGYQEGYLTIDTPHAHIPPAPPVPHILPVPQVPINFEPGQHHHHHYDPGLQSVYTNPLKYEHAEPVQYQYVYPAPAVEEQVQGNLHESPPPVATSFQTYYPSSHHELTGYPDGELIAKPAVVYVTSHRQTSITKTRKFPYKFHQPLSDISEHSVEHGHTFVPQPKPISPWHKILHIIGAFLPLGLLIAALKPPIIKMDGGNTTEKPETPLSKSQLIHLPLEHRYAAESEDACENKSICELILQGANENAEFAHKILWNFSIRWTEEDARKSGMYDLFKAVKKKNCSSIKC